VYQRSNSSFEDDAAALSRAVALEEQAQPCRLWLWTGSCPAQYLRAMRGKGQFLTRWDHEFMVLFCCRTAGNATLEPEK